MRDIQTEHWAWFWVAFFLVLLVLLVLLFLLLVALGIGHALVLAEGVSRAALGVFSEVVGGELVALPQQLAVLQNERLVSAVSHEVGTSWQGHPVATR